MTILIAILRFEPGRTLGSEVYLGSLLKALAKIVKREKIVIAASEKGVEWGRMIAPKFSWISQAMASSVIGRILSEARETEKLARAHRADVIFFPFNIMPKVSFPSVLLVHDLVSEFYIKKFPLYRPLYFRAVRSILKKSIKRADNLITISRFIADELSKSSFVKPNQQILVAPLSGEMASGKTRQPENFGHFAKKIILQTGDHLPHKSHITGLQAMAILSQSDPDLFDNLQLVLTGGSSRDRGLKKFVAENRLENNITFLGKVSDEELEWLVRESSLIVFPTLYEGFGLGIIEAQMREKAILISDIPVLREVSGNQAMFFEPEDPDALAEGIVNFMNLEVDYLPLIEAGRKNACKWRWEDHASKVLELLKKTAERQSS